MKFKLTWHEARKCWKKFSGGKTFYLGKGKCQAKFDLAGYNAALAEWEQLSGDIKAQAKAEEIMESDPAIQDMIDLAQQRRRYLEKEYPDKSENEAMEIDDALTYYRDRHVNIPADQTIQAHVDSFIKFKTAQVAADQKSPGRLRNIRTYLNRFGKFLGMQNGVDKITAVTLANYHAQVLTETASGVISDTGARDAMQVARQFIRRLWSLSVISLPNNIDSRDLEIHVQTKPIEPWNFEELGGILREAPEPLRLYLLLMANCGMTQKDISDLLPSQVDWQNGIITRKRSKTKKWDNVPTVSYPLWEDTFKLLKKHGKRQGDRVFSTADGAALVVDGMSSKNKGSKRDKINQMWTDWSTRQRIKNNKGLKAIRKTSATKLGENSKYARFSQFFLAQSPKTVADKHYVQPSQSEFNKALAWLGKQYE